MSDFAKDKDVPDTNVGDTISREAMGDAVNKIRVSKNETWYSFYQKVLNELCKLPSAEPERTTPGNIVIGPDGWLVYCPLCGAKMQSTMGQLNDDAQSTKGGDEE